MKKLLPITIILFTLYGGYNTVIAQVDAGVSKVLDPISGSTLIIGSTFPVTAEIVNYGSVAVTAMNIKFNIGINNSNTALDENWTGTLAVGDTMQYTFSAQFTLNDTSNSSTFCLADATGDSSPLNNSKSPVYYFAGPGTPTGVGSPSLDGLTIARLITHPEKIIIGFAACNNGVRTDVSLLSMGGKTLLTQTRNGGHKEEVSFNTSTLSKGMYLLVVRNYQGQLTRKLVF